MIIFNLYTPTSYLTFKVQSNISLRILCPNLNSLGEVPHQNWGTAEWKQWRYDQIEFNSNFSYKICTQFEKFFFFHIFCNVICALNCTTALNTKKRSRDKVFWFWKSKFHNTYRVTYQSYKNCFIFIFIYWSDLIMVSHKEMKYTSYMGLKLK